MSSNNPIISMMLSAGSSRVDCSSHTTVNGGDDQITSLLCLLASDVIAGVGLRYAIRALLRSHIPLIEFSTGIEMNVSQELERPEDELCIRTQTHKLTQFIVEVKGLKNRGQTCYANSLMQALASVQPLYVYLESLCKEIYCTHQNNENNDEGESESVALALLQTIQHINGHKVTEYRKRRQRKRRRSFLPTRFFSLSYSPGDPQRVMNIIAKHHHQFKSRTLIGLAGILEQQDAHELFSSLMDVLSVEVKEYGGKNRTVAAAESEINNDTDAPNNATTDVYEEEKKHDEGAIIDDKAYESMQINDAQKPRNTPKSIEVTEPTSATVNPFDGLCESTLKCATCHHTRPIQSTPFIGLSLPIANIQSEYLEDFLQQEYGTTERVEGVQCFACTIGLRIDELEEEDLLLGGAIASIRRRKKTTHKEIGDRTNEDNKDITGLLEESQQIRRNIDILKSLDPDVADGKLDCTDDIDKRQEIDIGLSSSLRPISPCLQDAYKSSLILRSPQVLCIHIQRRHFDPSCNRMVKVMRQVNFEEMLDLGSYCVFGEGEDSNFKKKTVLSTPRLYKLMSVIEHSGNAFSGHYQTYRRIDPTQNDWVLVSDMSATPKTWNDVRGCQAYMLFYCYTI